MGEQERCLVDDADEGVAVPAEVPDPQVLDEDAVVEGDTHGELTGLLWRIGHRGEEDVELGPRLGLGLGELDIVRSDEVGALLAGHRRWRCADKPEAEEAGEHGDSTPQPGAPRCPGADAARICASTCGSHHTPAA